MRTTGSSWVVALASLALLLIPSQSSAGRKFQLFTEEAETLPEGNVELEQWLWAEGRVPADPGRSVVDYLWWAPVVGISPQVEIYLPLQVAAGSFGTTLHSFAVDVRYRLVPLQQNEGFQPLVRLGLEHPLGKLPGPPHLQLDLVGSYDDVSGWRLNANLGARMGLPFLESMAPPIDVVATGALGASLRWGSDFHAGVETTGEINLTPNPGRLQLYAGPSLAWSHGSFWVTFGSLFGLTHDSYRLLPKVLWAFTF